jgi:hypothetical protein
VNMGVLFQGARQPFYHLVLDSRDWGKNGWDPNVIPVGYAPEEQLHAPALEGSTWLQEFPDGPRATFVHPFEYHLFLGIDHEGNFLPSAELRTIYGEMRRDVHAPEESDNDADDDED